MLTVLASADKVIGIKQTKKAINSKLAKKVFVSLNADPAIRDEITFLAKSADVEVVEVATMDELGRASGISVGAACAAIV